MYNINIEINVESLSTDVLKELTKAYIINICNEVYLLNKDVRSCAWVELPEKIVPFVEKDILKLIDTEVINYFVLPYDLMENNPTINHIQIFLYKYEWQKQLFLQFINQRNTVVGDFIFGKLLGYSDEQINKYFEKNNLSHTRKSLMESLPKIKIRRVPKK